MDKINPVFTATATAMVGLGPPRSAENRTVCGKIVSVNVGLPREVVWKGITVQTAIFKEPVAGSVAIRELNLAGDRQADLTVHGGSKKAVYAYPAEH
jgi:hypothetical protein